MGKESFIVYHSFYGPIKDLSLEEKGILLDAMFMYHIEGITPDLPPVLQMAFQFMKSSFDFNIAKYDSTVIRNQTNGSKGGRPKKENPNNPDKPSGFLNNPENPDEPKKAVLELDMELDVDKSKKNKFSSPTLNEVETFFEFKGYSKQAAQTAFSYYEAANWHDSTGKPVKNWKQKMIAVWFKPENQKQLNGKHHPELEKTNTW